jgi:ElaB/YqjD/DUF883 family membrane-anchored ribosome-binding protein
MTEAPDTVDEAGNPLIRSLAGPAPQLTLDERVRRDPWPAVAIAVVAGFVIGCLVPR